MTEIWIPILLLILGIAIGYALGHYIQKLKTKSILGAQQEKEQQLLQTLETHRQQMDGLTAEKNALSQEKEQLGRQVVRYEADMENLLQRNKEQKEEVAEIQEKFTKEFEVLANKILEEKSSKFTEQNQKNIKDILLPLQERIHHFEKKVEDSQKENIGIHSALKEQLLNLQNQNLKITQEAENLTKALKGDSKMQGNWGELVLERVLEKSGLDKDLGYSVQQSFTREDGSRVLPDVIIHLPNGNKMVVDSKVSLTDYERYVNAEEEDKERYLKSHVNSLKTHVEQLSAKNYHDLYEMESPDFVLMFVPIEPAFAVAANYDSTLYSRAFERNIVIVTPTTLLATLRTIDTMWNNEKQQRNALEIAQQAGRLYDSFTLLTDELLKVGNQIGTVQKSYQGVMTKLTGKGNLINRVETLKKLGAKASKNIDEKLLKRAREDDEGDNELKLGI